MSDDIAPIQIAEGLSPLDDINQRLARMTPPAAGLSPLDDINQRLARQPSQPAPAPPASAPAPSPALSPLDDINGRLARMAPPANDSPGFFSNFGEAGIRGVVQSAREIGSTPGVFRGETTTPEAPTPGDDVGRQLRRSMITDEGYRDPAWWGAQLGHLLGYSAPTLAGGMLGGAIGSAGGPVGTAIGGAAGFGAMSALQEVRPAYDRARAAGLDHDAAVDRALTESGIAGAVGAIMGGVGPALGYLRPIVSRALGGTAGRVVGAAASAPAQIGVVQPGLAVGQQVAEGAVEGHAPSWEDMAQTAALGVAQGAPTHAIAMAGQRGREAPPPRPGESPVSPTAETSTPGERTAPEANQPLVMPMRAEPFSVDPSRPAEPPPAPPGPEPRPADTMAAELRAVQRAGVEEPPTDVRPTVSSEENVRQPVPPEPSLRGGLEAIARGGPQSEAPAAPRAPDITPAPANRMRVDIGGGVHVDLEPTPEAHAAAQQMRSAVEAIAARKAPAGTQVRFASEIGNTQGGRATGAYDPATRTVWVALRSVGEDGRFRTSPEIANTALHEVFHPIWDNLLRPNERAALTRRANDQWIAEHQVRERWAHQPGADHVVEASAEAFAKWAGGDRRGVAGPVLTAFNRIAEYVRAVASWARGHGFTTPEMVFRRIDSGEVAARQPVELAARAEPAAAQAVRLQAPPLPSAAPPGAHGPAPTLPEPGKFNSRIGDWLSRAAPTALREVMHDVVMKIAPLAHGNVLSRAAAKQWISTQRAASAQVERAVASLKARFTPEQRAAMWNAVNQAHEDFAAGRDTTGKALAALPADQRAAVAQILDYSRDLWARAQDAGVVKGDAPSPFYAARMLARIGQDGSLSPLPNKGEGAFGLDTIGRNLTTKGTWTRKYDTAAETEAAGRARFQDQSVGVVRDIAANLLAFHRMERAIEGKNLIRAIKEYGDRLGVETVARGEGPNFFTLDHPAFKEWTPRHGARDENGETIFDRTPIYIAKEWEGPLRAVLTAPTGRLYNALMAMKSGATSMIMISPLMHLSVEFARALPALKGKIFSLQLWKDGHGVLSDDALHQQMLRDGVSPINRRGFVQDITQVAAEPQLSSGKSMVSRALGSVSERLIPGSGEKVRSGVDAAGHFWHGTLLWDRIAALQAGIWKTIREDMIAQGHDPVAAGRTAAEIANNYAGAMPTESMSQAAAQIGNVAMFSRSFTAGNLAVFKNATRGLSRGTLSWIARDAGDSAAVAAQKYARRKALGTLAVDMAITVAGLSLLQNAAQMVLGGQSLGDIGDGYARRLHALLNRAAEHPAQLLMRPIESLSMPFAQSENEPGKTERVHIGNDSLGRGIYVRNPFSKMGEEFLGWLTRPREMLLNKESTLIRPLMQVLQNDRGFGRHVYDPNGNALQILGDIALNTLRQQVPEGMIAAAGRATGVSQAAGLSSAPAGRAIDTAQAVGPLAGLFVSQGHPKGPAAGVVAEQERQVRDARGAVNQMIADGRVEEAMRALIAQGMSTGQARGYVRSVQSNTLSQRRVQTFMRGATPEQVEQFNTLRGN